MDIPTRFAAALRKTSPGNYYTLAQAHVEPNEMVIISPDGSAVTDSRSEVPVIGTEALAVCAGLIAYNKKSKAAAMIHTPHPEPAMVERLLTLVRGNSCDAVDFHIIGKPFEPGDSSAAGSINSERRMEIDAVLAVLEQAKNVKLKTLDVIERPKPHAVAIDSRNGRLIRGSELFTTYKEVERDIREGHVAFPGGEYRNIGDHFDGTQLPRQRRR